jgi:hypothetical protein
MKERGYLGKIESTIKSEMSTAKYEVKMAAVLFAKIG